MQRFTKNTFIVEKNNTIVNFPVKYVHPRYIYYRDDLSGQFHGVNFIYAGHYFKISADRVTDKLINVFIAYSIIFLGILS